MEEKFTKRALDQLKAQNPDTAETTGQLVSLVPQEGVDKPFLYDLVFDSAALTKDGASKVHRCGFMSHTSHCAAEFSETLAHLPVYHCIDQCLRYTTHTVKSVQGHQEPYVAHKRAQTWGHAHNNAYCTCTPTCVMLCQATVC